MSKVSIVFALFLVLFRVTLISQPGLGRTAQVKYPNVLGKDYEADVPWCVKSVSEKIPFSVVIAGGDADNFTIKGITISVKNGNTWTTFHTMTTNTEITTRRYEYLYNGHSAKDLGLTANADAYFKINVSYKESIFSYTFTKKFLVHISDSGFPKIPGWYYGDTHFHSEFTSNNLEFGSGIASTAKAAKAMGLDWLTITDHSCDFDSAGIGFRRLEDSIALYGTQGCFLIRGEEVTIDNNITNDLADKRIHLLVYDNPFIRGPEEPVAGTLDTRGNLTFLSDAMKQVVSGFAYAAHPYSNMEILGVTGISPWLSNIDTAQKYSAFKGLELWNERVMSKKNVDADSIDPLPFTMDTLLFKEQDDSLKSAISQWHTRLLSGDKKAQALFICGGSDAHGCFNYATYRTSALSPDVWAQDNALAKIRTAVYCPNTFSKKEVLNGLAHGRAVATDGPLAIVELDINGDKKIDSTDGHIGETVEVPAFRIADGTAQLHVQWNNRSEYGGAVSRFVLYYNNTLMDLNGKFGIASSLQGEVWITLKSLQSQFSLSFSGTAYSFFRLEAYTAGSNFRCYTNPIWMRTTSGVGVQDQSNLNEDIAFSCNYPNPCNPWTNILWRLAKPEFGSLILTDIQGRTIRVLHTGVMKAGMNSLTWDGCDDKGLAVSSGVYQAVLRIQNKTLTRKILLSR